LFRCFIVHFLKGILGYYHPNKILDRRPRKGDFWLIRSEEQLNQWLPGVHERTQKRLLKDLEDQGLIDVRKFKMGGENAGKTMRYVKPSRAPAVLAGVDPRGHETFSFQCIQELG